MEKDGFEGLDFDMDLDFDPDEPPEATAETSASTIEPETDVPELPALQILTGKRMTDLIKLKPEWLEKIPAHAAKVDIMDSNVVTMYGINFQQAYLDSLTDQLGKTKIGELGQAANRIILSIDKAIDLAAIDKVKAEIGKFKGLKQANAFFGQLFGGLFNAIKALKANQQTLVKMIRENQTEVQNLMHTIAADNARLDIVVRATRKNFFQLGFHILAGEQALDDKREEFFQLREKALEGSIMELTDLVQLKDNMLMFDSRLFALKTGFVEAPIAVEEIMAQQKAGRMQMVNLMNMLFTTMPKLLRSLSQLINLYNLKEAQWVAQRQRLQAQKLDDLKGQLLHEVVTEAKRTLFDVNKQVENIAQKIESMRQLNQELKKIEEEGVKNLRQQEGLLVQFSEDFRQQQADSTKHVGTAA